MKPDTERAGTRYDRRTRTVAHVEVGIALLTAAITELQRAEREARADEEGRAA